MIMGPKKMKKTTAMTEILHRVFLISRRVLLWMDTSDAWL